MKDIPEDLIEEFYKYMAWTKASGIHSQELYKAIADFWLSKCVPKSTLKEVKEILTYIATRNDEHNAVCITKTKEALKLLQ